MPCGGFLAEDYGLYVLGSLEPAERDQIAEHLADNCAVCTAEINQYRLLWPVVGAATPLVTPRRNLRARVIQSVGGRASWWAPPLPLLATPFALAIAVVGGWYLAERRAPISQIAFAPVYKVEVPNPASQPATIPELGVRTVVKEVPVEKTVEKVVDNPAQAAAIATLNQDLARERQRATELSASLTATQRALADSAAKSNDSSERALAALTSRTRELERQVTQYRVLLETERKRADQSLLLASMASDPALRLVKLRATEKNELIEGHAIIGGSTQMVFYASKLPALPSNRVYQLWLIRGNDKAIASAGTFTPDGSSRGTLQLKDPSLLKGVTTIAVTDEPAGGSMLPTGHKWLIGS
jgi:hypothetical protein